MKTHAQETGFERGSRGRKRLSAADIFESGITIYLSSISLRPERWLIIVNSSAFSKKYPSVQTRKAAGEKLSVYLRQA